MTDSMAKWWLESLCGVTRGPFLAEPSSLQRGEEAVRARQEQGSQELWAREQMASAGSVPSSPPHPTAAFPGICILANSPK